MATEFDPFANFEVQMSGIEILRARKEANNPILCEIFTEFYGSCGHYVYRTYCNNPDRRLIDDMLQDPATCCDATCSPRNQRDVVVHDIGTCLWCTNSPIEPDTTMNRSDGEEGAFPLLRVEEVNLRRLENHLPPLTAFFAVQLERRLDMYRFAKLLRESRQALSETVDDRLGLSALERQYYTGFGYDDSALYAPITDENFGSILGINSCYICRSKKEFAPNQRNAVMLPCKHAFHKSCIIPWHEGTHTGSKNTTCPTCRHRYLIDVDEDEIEDYIGA